MMATMGAKNSRAPDLRKRWDELASQYPEGWDWDDPPGPIVKFIDQNLAGYSHASIAEMAALWVYSDGFGWPSAWLLLDFPLFIGQEASSRVIDQRRVAREMCRFAPDGLQELHDAWMDLYDELKGEKGGVYTQDKRRFALPGTMRTGLGYYNNQVRAVVRHLEEMSLLGDWQKEIADEYLAAAEISAPHTVRAARRDRDYCPNGQWYDLGLRVETDLPFQPSEGVELENLSFEPTKRRARPQARRYMNRMYAQDGQFRVTHLVSVGTARDEHRHRACMPWKLEVVVDDDLNPVLCPYTPFEVDPDLWAKTCAEFRRIWDTGDRWGALHALPFCAYVAMTSVTTIDALVYKAELRAGAEGGHWEYREQNLQLIRDLCGMLPPWFVRREHLAGLISGGEQENLL